MALSPYDAFDDPYVYRGTTVLRNKIGTRDPDILENFELEMTTLRAEEPFPSGKFDAAHYRQVHHHIFQDVYSWAGRYRTVRTAKGGNLFCFPENIPTQLDLILNALDGGAPLENLTMDQFVSAAAELLANLNAVHAFREGNGRCQLSFLALLAARVGHPLKLENIRQEAFLQAMIESFAGKTQSLASELRHLCH
ncbi:MAG TPA: Fic family protein [Asticcacaulis sp.]|nr:Fic family protein [Asticcacaulis sp.]